MDQVERELVWPKSRGRLQANGRGASRVLSASLIATDGTPSSSQ